MLLMPTLVFVFPASIAPNSILMARALLCKWLVAKAFTHLVRIAFLFLLNVLYSTKLSEYVKSVWSATSFRTENASLFPVQRGPFHQNVVHTALGFPNFAIAMTISLVIVSLAKRRITL